MKLGLVSLDDLPKLETSNPVEQLLLRLDFAAIAPGIAEEFCRKQGFSAMADRLANIKAEIQSLSREVMDEIDRLAP